MLGRSAAKGSQDGIQLGIQEQPKPSYPNGRWFVFPDGRGFGLRVSKGEKGTGDLLKTIDITNLDMGELPNIIINHMKRDFKEEEKAFLTMVADDCVPLVSVVPPRVLDPDAEPPTIEEIMLHVEEMVEKNEPRSDPTVEDFNLAIDFITFLHHKYKKGFHYTFGAGGRPINKTFDELITWLRKEFVKGNYRDTQYAVWFDIDEEMIPTEYWIMS